MAGFNDSGTPLDFEHYFRLLVRQKWFLVFPTLLGLATMLAYGFSLSDLYSAKATILVEPQSLPKEFMKSTLPYGPETYLRSLVEQIKSTSRLEQVIHQYNLYPDQMRRDSLEEVVNFMRDRIKIEQRANDTFSVSFIGEDPLVVQQVTTTLTDMFIDENLRFRLKRSEENVAFLESQAESLRANVLEKERRVQDYKSQHLDSLPENRSSNELQLSTTQQRLQSNVTSLSSSSARLSAVRDRIAMLAENQSNPAAAPLGQESRRDSLEVSLEQARRDLTSLELQLSDKHPDVKRKRREVKALEAEYAARPAQRTSSGRQPRSFEMMRAFEEEQLLVAEIENLQREQAQLNAQLTNLSQRIELTPRVELQLSALSRDLEVLKERADDFQKKATDAGASLALERQNQGSQFRALDRARVPTKPDWPNRPMLALIGAFGGLAVGFGLVIGLDILFRPFLDDEDLARFAGLPVLVAIPHIGPFPSEWQRFLRQISHLLNYLLGSLPLGGTRYAPSTLRTPAFQRLAAGRADPSRVDSARTDPSRADSGRADSARTDTRRAGTRPEPAPALRTAPRPSAFSYLTGDALEAPFDSPDRVLVQATGAGQRVEAQPAHGVHTYHGPTQGLPYGPSRATLKADAPAPAQSPLFPDRRAGDPSPAPWIGGVSGSVGPGARSGPKAGAAPETRGSGAPAPSGPWTGEAPRGPGSKSSSGPGLREEISGPTPGEAASMLSSSAALPEPGHAFLAQGPGPHPASADDALTGLARNGPSHPQTEGSSSLSLDALPSPSAGHASGSASGPAPRGAMTGHRPASLGASWASPAQVRPPERWFLDERPAMEELLRELTLPPPWENEPKE